MSDNVLITPGLGTSIATDDVGGVQFQRVKATFGVDGVATDVSATNPLPAKLGDGTNSVTVGDSVTAASETVSDRLKVNAAMRYLDTAQGAGSQLVAAKGDQASGLWVNVKSAQPALVAGSAIIGKVGIDQTTPGTTNLVSIGTNGTVAINAAIPTGANTIGAVTGSGNFAITAAALPLPSGASTSANQPTAATAASTTSGQTGLMNLGAVTTAAPAYTTATSNFLSLTTTGLLRTDGSGVTQPVSFTQAALPANQSVNAAQIAGTTTDVNSGLKSAGTLRVVLATDQPALTNKLLVTPDSVALPANQSVNVSQINGVAPTMGTGVVGTGVQRMTLATDVALPTGANVIGGVTQSGTWTVQPGNTANTTPWLAKLHDGTTAFKVAPASTAAATADPAVVVSFAGANSATKIGDGTNNAKVVAASSPAAFVDAALVVDVRPGGALLTAQATLADALANVSLGRLATLNSLYNGTTWDLQRGMGGNATTGDAGAKTVTGNGATQTNVGNKGVSIVLNMGAVTGTTPTFVLKVQGSADGGTTWYDVPGATTASLVATGVWGITVYPGSPTVAGTTTSITGTASCGQPLPRTWRVVWTIGGTTPSFTITNVQYNYLPN